MITLGELVKRKTQLCEQCREPVTYTPVLKRGEVDHHIHFCETCGEYEGKTVDEPAADPMEHDSYFLKQL